MATNWTAEQRRAIETPGSLIVSAAAGSGKTAVLTERIARHILEGASPDDLLVVTFTRAAAAEMKKRIGDRLSALAAQQQGDEAARLYAAVEGIGRANISTIDGFCSHVLRRHFDIAGLDPAFRAGEEAENLALRQEALEELMERYYAQKGFSDLVDAFGEEAEFSVQFLRLYEFIMAQPEPMEWLRGAIDKYDIAEDALPLCPAAEEYLKGLKVRLGAYMDILRSRRDEIAEDYPKTAAILDDDLTQLGGALLQKSLRGYANQLSACAFATFSMRGAEKSYSEYVKKPRDDMKKEVKKHIALSGKPMGRQAKLLAGIKPLLDMLYSFTGDFIALYSEKKEQAGIIDYADMEHIALRLLRLPAVAREYRDRFSFVFIDEYQDCSPLQNALFSALARPDNLFIVGDVKQSIYGFRMAEPSMFTERIDEFSRRDAALHLSANFRSSNEVIEGVNSIFTPIMTRETGGVDYDETARLVHGRRDASPGGTELHVISRSAPLDAGDAADENAEEQLLAAEAEALFAAGRIRELLGESFTDRKGNTRNYKYSDIVILHSSPKNVAEAWVRTLSREGIPVYAELTGGYFDAIEVQIFLNLLAIIDNPLQDIPLISVLRSPIGGFSTEELITLRADCREGLFYEALKAGADKDTPLGHKAGGFLDRLKRWRAQGELYDITELIAMLLEDTGFENYVSALPGGQSRRANLEALIKNAGIYSNSGHGIRGFLRFMEKARSGDSLGAAQIASANVVRLISIHKSKGLEFPAVILGGLSVNFNKKSRSSVLVLDSSLGIGMKAARGNSRELNLYHSAIAERIWRREISERMRLLYVAMTRASEKLIMLCSFREVEKGLAAGRIPVTPNTCAGAERFADWILPVLFSSPSGNPLREYLGMPPLGGHKTILCSVHPTLQISTLGAALPREEYLAFTRQAVEDGPGEYAELFAWRYPYGADTVLPSKISVSQLIGNLPELGQYPDFMRDSMAERAVSRGTAAHKLMEHLPIAKHTFASVNACLKELTDRGILTKKEAEGIYAANIVDFFSKGLGSRMLASPRVERELAFNHRVKANSVFDADTEETLLLQGIIDCCFIEGGKWVLMDYKTDYVPKGRAKEVAMSHSKQLRLYKSALEELTGIPVKECWIHLLSTGESVLVQ
ncbi:MAG: helicase-exonuclease AddAB subunit AddA [Christensenellales bacterium]